MACKKFCCFRKVRLTEDSECLIHAVEAFLTAHRLLKNFMDFFKFHAGKCCGINYDDVPLHGALDIVAVAAASIICGNVPNKESQRPRTFHTYLCTPCRDTQVLPEDIISRVDVVLSCLRRPCNVVNIICQIKDILSALGRLSLCAISEKLQVLALLLKEIMKQLICCDHDVGEPFGNTQVKSTLNLVNNFIRDWSEKRTTTRPTLRLCRFCDHVISESTRQWGTFCCNDAQLFNSIWKEWALKQSILETPRDVPCDSRVRWKSSTTERCTDIDKDSGTYASAEQSQTVCVTNYESRDAKPDRCVCDRGARRRVQAEGFPKKTGTEAYDYADREQDKFDTVGGGDLTKTADRGLEGKLRGDIRRSRDIDRSDDYPLTPDGREKRDDAFHKKRLDKIRRSRGLRDTDEEGTIVGKRRGIKTTAGRQERSRFSETDSEDRKTGRSKKGKKKVLYRNALQDDTDSEEKTTDRRRRKKARKGRDGLDSERKGMSYSEDDEEKVRKRDRKRKGRSISGRDETGSEFTKKRSGVKATSSEDKSTPGSEGRRRKDKSVSSKGRGLLGSGRTDDDYSKTIVSDSHDVQKAGRSSIEYQLSNQHFIKLGWTVLPVAKAMSKIVLYHAKPAKPHLDWFKRHRLHGRLYYDDETSIFVNFLGDGSAEVYYPNGMIAIKVQRPRNRKYDMYTVFSPGGKDCMGIERKSQIVAVFDTTGNGAVFDEDGETRLSYNQIGGIWRDSPTGVPTIWKWDIGEMESITKTVFVEKPVSHLRNLLSPSKGTPLKSMYSGGSGRGSTSRVSLRKEKKKPSVTEPEDKVEEEEDEPRTDIHEINPEDACHFKPIGMKLNDFIGLKILNRRNISLLFRFKKKSIRIELGTIMNLNKEVASYFVDTSAKYDMLKSKFEDLLSCHLTLASSVYKIAEELRKIKKSARQRNFMMDKYKPSLRVWKQSGTRCRPR